jgi:hypothetical protein
MAVETLVVVAAVTAGQEQPLREALAPFRIGSDEEQDKSPFTDVPGTHVARFVVMSALGTGDPTSRKRLRPVRLLFSAVVDGPAEAWLWGLFEKQGEAFERVWRHCVGWPERRDSTARSRWLLDQRLPVTYSVIAHDVSVAEIERALAVRQALREVAAEPAGLSPAELRAVYRRTMAQVGLR